VAEAPKLFALNRHDLEVRCGLTEHETKKLFEAFTGNP